MAQDHLGGQREDLLLAKLDQERFKQDEEQKKKDKLRQREQSKMKAEKEVREEMRQEFLQQTQKSPGSKQGKRGKSVANVDEKYEINMLKKQNEDAFFDKWIKQREAQGISLKKRIIGREKDVGKKIIKKKKKVTISGNDEDGESSNKNRDDLDDVREGDDIQSSANGTTLNKYASPAGINRKTKTLKDLQALQEQAKQVDNMKSLKIEERQVRKELNVKIITPKTLEALLLFLGIQSDDSRQGLDNKLNQARIEI